MGLFPARRVVVPVDFSPLSRAAWSWARALSEPKAELEALYVHDFPPSPVLGLPAPFLGTAEKRRLLKLLSDSYEGCRPEIDEGSVAAAILRRTRGADVVVMGTHGRTGLDRAINGSVCEGVVRSSPIPVLAVKSPFRRVRSVLAPVNLTAYAKKGLRVAAECADFLGAGLTALNVDRDSLQGENPRYYLGGMLARLPGPPRSAAEARVLLRAGEPVPVILAESVRHDLVVLTAHRKSLLEDIVLGTTAERVLRHALVPVLAVPDGAAQ